MGRGASCRKGQAGAEPVARRRNKRNFRARGRRKGQTVRQTQPAAIACAVIATAFLIQRPGDWSHDRIMLSTIVNLERMAHRSAAQTTVSALNGGFVTSSD